MGLLQNEIIVLRAVFMCNGFGHFMNLMHVQQVEFGLVGDKILSIVQILPHRAIYFFVFYNPWNC